MNSKASIISEAEYVNGCNKAFKTLYFKMNQPTNIVAFKESAYAYSIQVVGRVANVIQTERLYKVEKPCIPIAVNDPEKSAFHKSNDPHGILKKQYEIELTEFVKHCKELRSLEVKLFGMIWSNCSASSQERIQNYRLQAMNSTTNELQFIDENGNSCAQHHPNAKIEYEEWDNVFISCNVLSLVRRINATHMTSSSGVDVIKQEATQLQYESIRMGASETLENFRKRFKTVLEARKSVNLPDIVDSAQASRFIHILDAARYSRFKIELENYANNFPTFQYPSTLEQAFNSAYTWRVEKSIPVKEVGQQNTIPTEPSPVLTADVKLSRKQKRKLNSSSDSDTPRTKVLWENPNIKS